MSAKTQALTGRELGEEILAAVRQMKTGKVAHETRVARNAPTQASAQAGLSQARFADLLGVSPRTLQD